MKSKMWLKTILVFGALLGPVAAQAFVDQSQISEAESAILDAGKNASVIHGLHGVPSLGVIHIPFWYNSPVSESGNQVARLRILEERNAGGIGKLRHALSANPATRQALSKHGVNMGQVVGVQIGSTGSLRVFVDY